MLTFPYCAIAQTQTLSVVMTYGLRWTDSRLVGAMMTEPRRTWRPKLALDAALLDVTEVSRRTGLVVISICICIYMYMVDLYTYIFVYLYS